MAYSQEAVLLVQGGPDEGATIALSEGVNSFGRGPTSDVVLDYPSVSREHARIRGDIEAHWIVDLGSRNGTYVNGERLGKTPRRLLRFDRIKVGDERVPVHRVFMESRETTVLDRPRL